MHGKEAVPWIATTQHLETCRDATHWLFSHLIGVRGVRIPDTALFDDEGVLTDWLYAHSPPPSKKRATSRHHETVVLRRDVLELSLLRLENHLQDLVREKPDPRDKSKRPPNQSQCPPVAVIYNHSESEPASSRVLSEVALDAVIRTLCARQRSLTSPEPDLSVARAYPGGRFVLQAATITRPLVSILDAATIVTSYHCSDNGTSEGFTHAMAPLATASCEKDRSEAMRREQAEAAPLTDWSATFARAETLGQAVVTHLRACHGISMRRLTLEFHCVAACGSPGDRQLTLTSARAVEWVPPARPVNREGRHNDLSRDGVPVPVVSSRRPTAFRVCRQCRTPTDVELARELQQQQTLMRSVLAKYQHQGERLAEAETRCRWAGDRSTQLEQQLVALEAENLRLRERISMHTMETQCIDEEKLVMEQQLVHAQQQQQCTEQQLQDARTRIRELLWQQAQQAQRSEHQIASWQREWDALNAQRTKEIHGLRDELDRHTSTCSALRTQLEETRAARDELQFQWAFVVRKLTDMSDGGVLPPRRIAGGYTSYPTPTPANVEQVVKWIVDYEARRTVLDAGLVASPVKSAKRRLQIKVELMRLLASGPTSLSLPVSPQRRSRSRSRSPSRRQSPRRKASRSPQKKKASPTRTEMATLVHDHIVETVHDS